MSAMGDSIIRSIQGQAGSTIERLAELAKAATQGEWLYLTQDVPSLQMTFAGVQIKDRYVHIAQWEQRADAQHIAACNPAAIAQARAEYAELENGVSEIFAKHCSDFPDAATANNATKLYAIEGSLSGLSGACDDLHAIIAELERRNAELVGMVRAMAEHLRAANGIRLDSRAGVAAYLPWLLQAQALAHSAQEI